MLRACKGLPSRLRLYQRGCTRCRISDMVSKMLLLSSGLSKSKSNSLSSCSSTSSEPRSGPLCMAWMDAHLPLEQLHNCHIALLFYRSPICQMPWHISRYSPFC